MSLTYLSLHSPQARFSDLPRALTLCHPNEMLESALSTYLERQVKVIGSGRYGIKIALQVIGTKTNDEVITPSFICSSVGEAVLEVGARPVFADVNRGGVNMDPDIVESLVTPRTKAIIVAHIFGIPARVEKLLEIAQRHKLILIEDCSQALGSRHNGRLAGTWGNFSIFSFGISKQISTSGGGAICYHQHYSLPLQKIAKTSKRRRTDPNAFLISLSAPLVFRKHFYGMSKNAISRYSGFKHGRRFSSYEGNMKGLDAACAVYQLRRHEDAQRKRNDNARIYESYFKNYFELIRPPAGSEPAYLYYPVLTSNAPALKKRLHEKSIEVKDREDMLFYALYEHPIFKRYKQEELRNVDNLQSQYLVFPVGHSNCETESICKKTIKAMTVRL